MLLNVTPTPFAQKIFKYAHLVDDIMKYVDTTPVMHILENTGLGNINTCNITKQII